MTSETTVAILAAGRGSRLAPLTDELPKCLLPIGDTSTLGAILDALDAGGGVREIRVVAGHAAGRIEAFLAGRRARRPAVAVFNPEYDTANNIVSARLLASACAGGFVLVNSDVLCHPAILAEALAASTGSFLVVDETRPPRDEAMKVRYAGGRLTAISKGLDPATADGEYVGIARFDAAGARAFFDAVEAIVAEGGLSEWYEAAIARAATEIAFGRVETAGRPWLEIDDFADLERARREVAPRLGLAAAGAA